MTQYYKDDNDFTLYCGSCDDVMNNLGKEMYVLLHTNGDEITMYRLKTKGHFQIWTRETLESYGFQPTHAPYYIVLLFDNTKKIPIKNKINLKEYGNTYRAKIRPLSDFLGIK